MKGVQGALRNRGLLYFLYVDICDKIHSYTDWHDVDENKMTITDHGGYWLEQSSVGAMNRHMYDSPTASGINVASIHNITQHNN